MFGTSFFGTTPPPPPAATVAHSAIINVQATSTEHAAQQGAMITEILQWFAPGDLEKLHNLVTTRPIARGQMLAKLREA